MIRKALYSLSARGWAGTLGLAGSYAHWYWKKSLSRDRRYLRDFGSFRMYLRLDDPGISTTLGRGGAREKAHTKVLLDTLRPGMRVLDIGANLGYYALLEAGRVGAGGRVYALEPVPDNFAVLRQNIALNALDGVIEAHPFAVAAATGRRPIFLAASSNLNTLFPTESRAQLTGRSVEVETVALGDFLAGKDPVNLIRMDIEGAEVDVLDGLAALTEAGYPPPAVLFETHRPQYDRAGRNIERPLGRLLEGPYTAARLISNNDDGTKWRARGYVPDELVATDGTRRGIYSGVSAADAIELIARAGGVRAVLLAPRA